MPCQNNMLYKALSSRDPRFDGIFFVGVTSTGIYCRPICPVKTPKQVNCRFFESAEAAEKEFFRPCLRCRPGLGRRYGAGRRGPPHPPFHCPSNGGRPLDGGRKPGTDCGTIRAKLPP